MTSSFTTGTINQPDAGSVGQAMIERMRDDIVAHDAWELVEEFTPAAGTARYYVFKCLSSVNGLAHDFYLIASRRLGDGKLIFTISDTYDSGPHELTGFPVAYCNYCTMDDVGRYPTPYALPTSGVPDDGNSNMPSSVYWTPSGTSTKWWLIVTEDSISAAWNGASNGFIHLGAYTYLGQLANDLPFMVMGSSVGQGAVVANPALADIQVSSNYGSAMRIGCGAGGIGSYNFVALGFAGPWKYNDKLQNNMRTVAEIGITMAISTYPENAATVMGYAMGKQKRMRWSGYAMPDGLAFGDAFALNGTLWVPWAPNDGRIFDTGVASS